MFRKIYTCISVATIALAIFFGGAFSVGVQTYVAQAQSNANEKIISFVSNLDLHSDASIDLSETIVYDFGSNERHGIYRMLRTKNADGKEMSVKVKGVTDENHSPYNYTTSKGSDGLTIKIGDANVLISGVHTYVISYSITNVATYFDDHDEFTWNVTGNDWEVPILSASAIMTLPSSVDVSKITYSCYRGTYGATGTCANKKIENNIVSFSDKDLDAEINLTVSVGVPKGIITPAKPPFDFTLLVWLLPIIIFIRMVVAGLKKRRDLKPGKTIIAEYEPPAGMMPTLVGSLEDGKVDNSDITAGLISAAEQGFVKITRIEKKWFLGSADYELTLLKPVIALPQITEQKIVEYFMENKNVGETIALSSLNKTSFAKNIADLKKDIYKEMVKRGFFTKNPSNRKIGYMVLGIIFLFGAITIGVALYSLHAGLAVLATGLLAFMWPYIVSVRTIAGGDVRRHILGFKKFISVTDKERFAFHDAPEKNPEQFMQYLPFAIALGVEEKWAKQFEGMFIPAPAWYDGASGTAFSAGSFARDMAMFTAFSGSVATPKSSGSGFSSGGGFSGGGGGGGGGGSW